MCERTNAQGTHRKVIRPLSLATLLLSLATLPLPHPPTHIRLPQRQVMILSHT